MKKLLNTGIRSSTLVEVIVALIIISMISGLAIMIYLNVQRSGFSSKRISAMMMIDEVYAASVSHHEYKPKEISYEGITIFQEVIPHSKIDLLVVRLEARDQNGKLIAEQKHLVYAPVLQP